MKVGVDVERIMDLPSFRNGLNSHKTIGVVNRDQVVSIWRYIRSAGYIAVVSDHAVRHAIQDDLRLGGPSRVSFAVDKVVSAKVGVGHGLGDAVVLLQADVFHVGRRLKVDFVEDRLISMKDEAESVNSLTRETSISMTQQRLQPNQEHFSKKYTVAAKHLKQTSNTLPLSPTLDLMFFGRVVYFTFFQPYSKINNDK